MCVQHKAEVLRAVAAYLDYRDEERGEFSVTIAMRHSGDSVVLCCRTWPGDEAGPASAPSTRKTPMPDLPASARWLSPLGEQIVAALADGQWRVTSAIVVDIGESADLRAVLRDLAARGILESCQRRGFRLLSNLSEEPAR